VTLKLENTIIVASFAALFIALVCFNLFLTPGAVGQKASVPVPADLNIAASLAEKLPLVPPKQAPASEGGEGAVRGWGRDPFASAWLKEATRLADPLASEAQKGLTVTLILISPTNRIAAINNRVYQEGDEIQDEKVVKISNDGVTLERNGVQRILPLRRNPIHINRETRVKER
jgi:hypothetical protein